MTIAAILNSIRSNTLPYFILVLLGNFSADAFELTDLLYDETKKEQSTSEKRDPFSSHASRSSSIVAKFASIE